MCLLLAASGCASWKQQFGALAAPGLQRVERKEKVVQSFESGRTEAQFAAALQRIEGGDPTEGRKLLEALVARRPNFVEGRLKLAELLWADEDIAGAELQLQAAVALTPERADVHHALGVLLESLARTDEAIMHLSRAAELEPANELYALSLPATTH